MHRKENSYSGELCAQERKQEVTKLSPFYKMAENVHWMCLVPLEKGFQITDKKWQPTSSVITTTILMCFKIFRRIKFINGVLGKTEYMTERKFVSVIFFTSLAGQNVIRTQRTNYHCFVSFNETVREIKSIKFVLGITEHIKEWKTGVGHFVFTILFETLAGQNKL